jgi:hypothetical protein
VRSGQQVSDPIPGEQVIVGKLDLAGGALKTPRVQPGLELLDGMGGARFGQSQGIRGLRKTTDLPQSGKNSHGFQLLQADLSLSIAHTV